MDSGRIHSSGTGATFWLMVFAIASHSTAGHAASAIHSSRSRVSGCSSSEAAGAGSATLNMAAAAASMAKTAYPMDHASSCARVEISGSMITGYINKAASDAKFEIAKRRYGN